MAIKALSEARSPFVLLVYRTSGTANLPSARDSTALVSIHPSFHDLTCCATHMWATVMLLSDLVRVCLCSPG